jgi:hypothetical protein
LVHDGEERTTRIEPGLPFHENERDERMAEAPSLALGHEEGGTVKIAVSIKLMPSPDIARTSWMSIGIWGQKLLSNEMEVYSAVERFRQRKDKGRREMFVSLCMGDEKYEYARGEGIGELTDLVVQFVVIFLGMSSEADNSKEEALQCVQGVRSVKCVQAGQNKERHSLGLNARLLRVLWVERTDCTGFW